MNIQELNSESYNQKLLLKKSTKMDLIFDQLLFPRKTVRNPTDHDYILWYKIQKFKKCVQVLGYALEIFTFSTLSLNIKVDKTVISCDQIRTYGENAAVPYLQFFINICAYE